jgi:hypothetical protein
VKEPVSGLDVHGLAREVATERATILASTSGAI